MNIKNISSAVTKEMYDKKIKFIDVREEAEHEAVRIPNTILIPMSEIQNRIEEIPKDEEVVIYCRTGHRSGILVQQLIQLGYSNRHNLEHGIVDWHQKNLPVDIGQQNYLNPFQLWIYNYSLITKR